MPAKKEWLEPGETVDMEPYELEDGSFGVKCPWCDTIAKGSAVEGAMDAICQHLNDMHQQES